MFSFRDIVLTTFILALVPAVLFRPHWGILLWTWIGLMNPHKLTWGFAYNFPFAMIVGVATIVGILISKEPKRFPWTPPTVVLLLFIIWMTVDTIFFSLYPAEAWPKWDKVIKIHFFIFLTMLMMQSEERIKALVLVATLSIAFFGIKGGAYTILRGGGGMVLGPDGGFIAGNTEIALALTVTLPLMRWLQLQSDRRWMRNVATVCMILIAISVLGSQSRGGLLALVAMSAFLWFKSGKKLGLAIVLVALGSVFFAFMPAEWHEKMGTIQTYEEDNSAMSRIGAWKFAWNLAKDRPIGGGGFETFQESAYERWAPDARAFDPHSIWFQVLGEQGFVGLGLFLLFWLVTWRMASQIIRVSAKRAEFAWAKDLAGMVQAALIGFWVGGTFLGLAYWDYPYLLAIVLALTKVVVERRLLAEQTETKLQPAARGAALRPQS